MQYRVIISPSAKDEINDIADQYFEIDEKLEYRFRQELRTAFLGLSVFAKAEDLYNGIRGRRLGKFPYKVYYRLLEEINTVLIVTVQHDAREVDLSQY